MPIYAVTDKKTIAYLFDGWDETFIWSCLQGCMGLAYSDSHTHPLSAQISAGDICFFAGEVNTELLLNRPENLQSDFVIFVPQNELWEKAIAHTYQEKALRCMRYATKKERDVFDEAKLRDIAARLPLGYVLKPVDHALYDEILSLDWARDLCSNYSSYEEYQSLGLGIVALKNGEIVSGASSYISFRGGIEIEIDTREDERRKGLASACGASLILECLKRDWYPSWDAHNSESLALAEKLGYHFDRAYPAFEISGFPDAQM